MPIRRRAAPARRPRRKVMNGRRRIAKPSRQIHHFKRTAFLGNVTATISALGVPTPIASGYSFSLSQLPNVAEFSALFDQYKITKCSLKFTPALSEGISSPLFGTSAVLGYSRFHSVIDFDDATPPVSEDQLLEYGSHKSSAPFKTHTRTLTPKALQEIYRSTLTTAYAPRAGTYIDMSYTDVPMYGVKVYCGAPNTPAGTAGSVTYKVYVTMEFACKNVR